MEYIPYYFGNSPSSQKYFESNNKCFDQIIPTWLQLKEDGSLLTHISDSDSKLFSKYNFFPYTSPLIQNYQLSSKVTNSFLGSEKNIDNGIKNMVNFLKNNSFDEINIDLEGVNKNNKENFLKFIEKLADKMGVLNYRLGISIPAKTENHVDTGWAGAYDYERLGRLVDKVIIMAYDYHWPGGPAGPIAPLSWVYDVIDYVIMQISNKKIYIGVPFYGYDWIINKENKKAKGLSYHQIMKLKEKYDGTIEWDQESETPYYCYESEDEKHEVWFENINSILKKLDLMNKFQIKGAAFWRLGLEPPELWEELSKRRSCY